ncbi:MAG: hypothetical protein FWF69_08590 [Firmicutes bacterium]|nr:hypothetical protein [Bacillota bacterium]
MEAGITPRRFSTRAEWRQWLQDNHTTESEAWFVFPLQSSGESAISYNDAVEEALCFGWIDSTVKSLDENHKILSDAYKRIRVAYIDAARKRPDEFKKRLKSFLEKTKKGKLITGYGGIDKYY